MSGQAVQTWWRAPVSAPYQLMLVSGFVAETEHSPFLRGDGTLVFNIKAPHRAGYDYMTVNARPETWSPPTKLEDPQILIGKFATAVGKRHVFKRRPPAYFVKNGWPSNKWMDGYLIECVFLTWADEESRRAIKLGRAFEQALAVGAMDRPPSQALKLADEIQVPLGCSEQPEAELGQALKMLEQHRRIWAREYPEGSLVVGPSRNEKGGWVDYEVVGQPYLSDTNEAMVRVRLPGFQNPEPVAFALSILVPKKGVEP